MKPFAQALVLLFLAAIAIPNLRAERLVLIAGGGTETTGAATNCRLRAPFGIELDPAGNLLIVEMAGGERLLKVDPRGQLSILAGTGEKGDSGDGGPASEARFNGMHNFAIGPGGDIFIADTWNSRVRRIDPKTGKVFAFAGTGKRGFSGDGGPALAAQFGNIYCLAFDTSKENLYLADLDNRRIRSINLTSGIVRTVAGNGQRGIPADDAKAIDAPLVDPRAVTLDSQDNIYILERSGHVLRRVDPNGQIRTVAGTGKQGSQDGDALQATFNGPKHLCVDRSDNVIIADTENHSIRKYLPKENKVIRIVGGTPSAGAASKPELNQPHGVYVDKRGTLYIADSSNNRVLKLEP
jgi:DNA-binding beta-propeller fold protein YncE